MIRALIVLALLAGCQRGTAIEAWMLDIEGGAQGVAITLPSNYFNELPLRPLDYTLRTQVTIEHGWRGQALVLEIDAYNGPLIARANGVVLDDSGDQPVGWRRFEIAPVDGDVLTIELALRRDLRAMLGLWSAPVIVTVASADSTGASIAKFNRISAIVALMIGLLLGLLYGAQFVIDHRAENLAVAVWAISNAAVAPLLILGIPGQVLGDLVGLFVLYGIVVSFISYFKFIQLTFDLPPFSRRWSYVWVAISVPSTVAIVAGHLAAVVACWAVLNLALVIANLVGPATLWRVARSGRSDAWLVFVFNALTVAMVFAEMSALATGRPPFGPIHPTPIGIALQAIAQAIVVSRRHVRRQREIQITNAALQQQVAERSRELGDALRSLQAGNVRPAPTGSLAQLRARFGDVAWARPLLAQISSQLAALHAKGVVHGDLKLEGIVVEGTIARIVGAEEGHTAGHGRLTPADDILAFGAIARELLGSSRDFDELIDRCLEPDPTARPAAVDLAKGLA